MTAFKEFVGVAAVNAEKDACVHGHPFDEANTYFCNGRRQCRQCNREAVVRYKQRHTERVAKARAEYARTEQGRERNRRWARAHRDEVIAAQRAQRELEPEKHRAWEAVGRAVRTGRLARPDACERCGANEFTPHAHHRDYAKPLNVVWLCPSCHKAEHKEQSC